MNGTDPITTLRAIADAQAKASPDWHVVQVADNWEILVAPDYSAASVFEFGPDHEYSKGSVGVRKSKANAKFAVLARNTDFAALLRAFEELQFELEKWRSATGMDDPIKFSQKSLSYIAAMNKKLEEIKAKLTNQPERP